MRRGSAAGGSNRPGNSTSGAPAAEKVEQFGLRLEQNYREPWPGAHVV